MSGVYLDSLATTACDPAVVRAMVPCLDRDFGNPASAHAPGRRAAELVDTARRACAGLLGVHASEILFTSGATESNNLCLRGLVDRSGERCRLLSTQIEHRSVLEPLRLLQRQGADVLLAPVNDGGRVNLEWIREHLDDRTRLISVHLANNELGTLQPLSRIVAMAQDVGALVHVDAAQAVGKVPVDVPALGVDYLSFSAHKFYGPKGVGGLWVRSGAPRPESLLRGGSQEAGLRPGTLNVPGIVGMGAAAQVAAECMAQEMPRLAALRDRFEREMMERIPGLVANGASESRLPGVSSLRFPDADAEALMLEAPQVACSAGSACMAGSGDISHVLRACGLSDDDAASSLRFGLGRWTTDADIDCAVEALAAAWRRATQPI